MPPRIRRRITTARREQIEEEQRKLEKKVVRPFDIINDLPVSFKPPGDYEEVLKQPLTVKDSGVLYQSLLKSRYNFMNVGPMFRLHWLRQTNYQRKMADLGKEIPEDKENQALAGGRRPVLGYEVSARDSMVKLHDGAVTLGPHQMEVRMFIAKDARSDKKELEAKKEEAKVKKEQRRQWAAQHLKDPKVSYSTTSSSLEPVTDPALSSMAPGGRQAPPQPLKPPGMDTPENVVMISNLNTIARTDESLNALMKIVASGSATPEQIVKFQAYIKRAKDMGPQSHHAHLFPGGVLPAVEKPTPPTQKSPEPPKRMPLSGMAGTQPLPPRPEPVIIRKTDVEKKEGDDVDKKEDDEDGDKKEGDEEHPDQEPSSPQPDVQGSPDAHPSQNSPQARREPQPQPKSPPRTSNNSGYEYSHDYRQMRPPRVVSRLPRDKKLTAFQERYLHDATLVFEFVENANVRFQFPKWAITEVIAPQTQVNADHGDISDNRDIIWSFLWIHNQQEFDVYEEKKKKYQEYLDEVKRVDKEAADKEAAEKEAAEKEAAEKEAQSKEGKDDDKGGEEEVELPKKRGGRPPPPKKKGKGVKKVEKPIEPEARYTPMSFTLHGVPRKYVPMYCNSCHSEEEVQQYMEHIFATGVRTSPFYLWYQVDGKLDENVAEEVREQLVAEEKRLPGAVDYIGKENEKKRRAKEKADMKKKVKMEEQAKEMREARYNQSRVKSEFNA